MERSKKSITPQAGERSLHTTDSCRDATCIVCAGFLGFGGTEQVGRNEETSSGDQATYAFTQEVRQRLEEMKQQRKK